MYVKLARGYATRYVNHLNDHSGLGKWAASDKCRQAMNAFEDSALSKKPGRTAKRLAPILKPAFTHPQAACWTKELKLIVASTITVAQENAVFDLSENTAPLFEERSVFLSNIFLAAEKDTINLRILTVANMGYHAIMRLLERDLATPDDMDRHVKRVLANARNIGMAIEQSNLPLDRPHRFLIPYENGALPVVTMKAVPARTDEAEPQSVISIRTFLDETMMTDVYRQRMNGFSEAHKAIVSDGDDSNLVAWVERNARPWVPHTRISNRVEPGF